MKNNGDMIQFLKQRDYTMINSDLGSGSFGKTVLLKDPFIDELFVAKKYEPAAINPEEKERFYKNFLDEIKILYKVNHKNIVRIYNYYPYPEKTTGYIIMEYIDGKNIAEFCSDYNLPFPAVSLDNVFIQLIDGFNYLENYGIIHRDIRENNILIDKSGIVKIIDFGIGKVIKKGEVLHDSLALEINREDSDTLPQEYYEGIYTSKTDMFYLGELLNRLIKNEIDVFNIDESNFSYYRILGKMMKKHPKDRYSSFSDIKEAIDKYDFSNMEITSSDKSIYQAFSDSLLEAIASFTDERKFNYNIDRFISQIDKALQINCFEHKIQDNRDVIRSIVVSGYSYSPSCYISYYTVKNFSDWFKKSTSQSQQLILNNIISKLSVIKIEENSLDIPF
jgi:serine/threonine-protein kinase